MRVISPKISLTPNFSKGETFHMWIGYMVWEDGEIVASVDLVDLDIPQIRQCGESEIGAMETVMDGADAVYHEMSRRIRKQIESNMRANAERVAASETLSEQ